MVATIFVECPPRRQVRRFAGETNHSNGPSRAVFIGPSNTLFPAQPIAMIMDCVKKQHEKSIQMLYRSNAVNFLLGHIRV